MAFIESCRSLIRALTLHDKEILKLNDECEFMLEFLLRQLSQHIDDTETLPVGDYISSAEVADPTGTFASDEIQPEIREKKRSKRKATMISS